MAHAGECTCASASNTAEKSDYWELIDWLCLRLCKLLSKHSILQHHLPIHAPHVCIYFTCSFASCPSKACSVP